MNLFPNLLVRRRKPAARRRAPSEQRRLHPVARRAGVGLLAAVGLALTVTTHLPWNQLSLRAGDIAPADVRAPRTVRVLNPGATELRREEVASSVPKVYDADLTARDRALESVREVYTRLRDIAVDKHLTSLDQKVGRAEQELPIRLSRANLVAWFNSNEPAIADDLTDRTVQIVAEIYDSYQIRSDTDDLLVARQRIEEHAAALGLSDRYTALVTEVAQKSVVRPNLIYNTEETERARSREMQKVEPVYDRVKTGDMVLRKGQTVTDSDIARLVALGLQNPRLDLLNLVGILAVAMILMAVVGYYLYQQQPVIWGNERYLWLVALLLVLPPALCRISQQVLGTTGLAVAVTATGAMLLGVLLDAHLALIGAAILSCICGMIAGNDLSLAMRCLISAAVGAVGVARIASRARLVKVALLLGAINVAAAVIFGAMASLPAQDLIYQAGWGAGSGLIAAMLTLGGAMFLERPFGITTDLRLLELSNTNEPVLRRMQLEAPGTYHASLIMATLAEAAAEAVGANSLLTRVCCYYHDIGKLRRPYLFVENQFGEENVHDRLSPNLSALAIMAHVKDGVELARELKLPQPIIEAIPQHHGTMLVSFFYRQALANASGEEVEESQFRYPGPKPQTRETGILMLADGVEAAVRSLKNPTKHAVEDMIDRIIDARLEDGQLNECPLTLRDIQVVRATFRRIMMGLMHQRIEYPQDLQSLRKKEGDTNGRSHHREPNVKRAAGGTAGRGGLRRLTGGKGSV